MKNIHLEPSSKYVRALKRGVTVVDSQAAQLLYGAFRYPYYVFPIVDIHGEILFDQYEDKPNNWVGSIRQAALKVGDQLLNNAVGIYDNADIGTADLKGLVAIRWESTDTWYEEAEEVFVHPHDPYHRLDVLRSSREIQVKIEDLVIAETTRPVMLIETGLPVRWYIPKDNVRLDLLEPNNTQTSCAYKGFAKYYSARIDGKLIPDVAWYYDSPFRDAQPVAGHVCFFSERFDVTIDGQVQPKTQTAWAKQTPSQATSDPIDG